MYERFDEVILTHTCRTKAELAYGEQLVQRLLADPLVGEEAAGSVGEVEPGSRCLVERKGQTTYLVSRLELDASGMRTIDTGHDPDSHAQVWGSLAGPFRFSRTADYSHEIPAAWHEAFQS